MIIIGVIMHHYSREAGTFTLHRLGEGGVIIISDRVPSIIIILGSASLESHYLWIIIIILIIINPHHSTAASNPPFATQRWINIISLLVQIEIINFCTLIMLLINRI